MCLLAWNWQPGSAQPLLLVGNRDEFYARPTEPLHHWPNAPILAGRDVQAGGTWLGIHRSRQGTVRLAALTNYRSAQAPRTDAPSRGALATDFLQGDLSTEVYLETLRLVASAYNPFNILVFDGETLLGFESRDARVVTLQPGIGAVSNAEFNTPWPKLRQLSKGLANCVAQGTTQDADLWPLLQSRSPITDAELPHTGVPLALERALSPVFIATPHYGTRACSVVRLGPNGAQFSERRFGADGPLGETSLTLSL